MKVKIYLEEGATLPKKAHPTDHGYDVTANRVETLPNGVIEYGTGIHIGLPERDKNGLIPCMFMAARSSVHKTGLILSNGKGVCDNPYRGEYMAKFYPILPFGLCKPYEIGDKIAQIFLSNGEEIEWDVVDSIDELGETDRGQNGYGSTGK